MKKKMLLILSILLVACSSDNIEAPVKSSDTENKSKTHPVLKTDSSEIHTLAEINKSIQTEYKNKGYRQVKVLNDTELHALKENYLNKKQTNANQGMMGPFTAPAVQTKIKTNEKIILSHGVGGLATGVYFCDVYSFKAEIQLPPGSFGAPEVPSPVGYNNLAEQELGITSFTNSGPSGSELVIYTLTLRVNYNTLGQYINKVIPTSLQDGFDYTYYYITTP